MDAVTDHVAMSNQLQMARNMLPAVMGSHGFETYKLTEFAASDTKAASWAIEVMVGGELLGVDLLIDPPPTPDVLTAAAQTLARATVRAATKAAA